MTKIWTKDCVRSLKQHLTNRAIGHSDHSMADGGRSRRRTGEEMRKVLKIGRGELHRERQATNNQSLQRILRTGAPWRDLPPCFGHWHNIYMRFQRGNEKALWWKVLQHLQSQKRAKMNIIICDSSTFKYHRHGGGQKGGYNQREEAYLA